LITIINNGAGTELQRKNAKNDAYYNYIKTGVFSGKIRVDTESPININFSSSAKKLIMLIYATDGTNRPLGTYFYFPNEKTWRPKGLIEESYYTGDLLATQLIATTGSPTNGDTEFEYNIEIPIPTIYISGYDLHIVLRGGSIDGGDKGTLVFYRNLKVTTNQQKELHAFTNINKVSHKPDDLEVLNGDGYNGGYTKSTLVYQKETTVFPYISKAIPTSVWQDSSEQEQNGILAFSARAVINNYSVRRNIVNASLLSKSQIEIGKLLSFDGFSKFKFKRLLVSPPFTWYPSNDEYNTKLFELSCDLATGRLTEYYNDGDDIPLAKSITDYTGNTCKLTFSLDSVCVRESFTVKSICI
jgi:hypothetical protein